MISNTQWNVFMARCPSRTSLARIANKWTAMIVMVLAQKPCRFGEIKTSIAGISGKVLTDTLRALERDGLVSRRKFAEIPPRVEYQLTPLGETLIKPLSALQEWAESHIEEVLAARTEYDQQNYAKHKPPQT